MDGSHPKALAPCRLRPPTASTSSTTGAAHGHELGRLPQATRQRPAPQLGAPPARPQETARDRCEPLLGARRGTARTQPSSAWSLKGSNPPSPCCACRGPGREGALTCGSPQPVVTAHARQGPAVPDAAGPSTDHGPPRVQLAPVPSGRGRLRRSGPLRPGTDRPAGSGKADASHRDVPFGDKREYR
jgi:hypothetical protein